MNVFDNEVVVEWIEGVYVFRDLVTGEDKVHMLFAGVDPNGILNAPTGSVAFGPAGSWENTSALPGGTTWQLIGSGAADGFLAPNEFYVDTVFPLPGPTGREVQTIEAAITLAEGLFAAGVDIIIRLREGQQHHVSSGFILPATRNWSIYSEATIIGQGIDPSLTGQIVFDGTGLSLPQSVAVARLELENVAVSGPMMVHAGWVVVQKDVEWNGLSLILDQGGGVAPAMVILCEGCSDNVVRGGPAPTMRSLLVTTTNHGGPLANPSLLHFTNCELTGLIVDGLSGPWFSLGNAVCSFYNCTFFLLSAVVLDVPGPYFSGSATFCVFEFVGCAIDTDFTVTGAKGQRLFDTNGALPVVKFVDLPISVTATGTGFPNVAWSLGSMHALSTGSPRVVNGLPPFFTPGGGGTRGLILADETISGLLISGRAGAGTQRVMDGEGYALAGGSYIYGFLRSSAGADTRIPLFLPQSGSDNISFIPIPTNRIARFEILVTARSATQLVSAWSYSGVIQNNAGVTSSIGTDTGNFNETDLLVGLSAYNAAVSVLTGFGEEGIKIEGSVPVVLTDWRVRALWFLL